MHFPSWHFDAVPRNYADHSGRGSPFHSLVPSYSALCRLPLTPALRPSQRFLLWGFGAVLGFASVCFVGFKAFWNLALVQQALPAIFFAALRRFGGAALLRGLRPSPIQGAPFWPSGLTLRSSGPAFCGPLTLPVSHNLCHHWKLLLNGLLNTAGKFLFLLSYSPFL